MFKKFSEDDSISSCSQVKSSVIRGIRGKLVDQMPILDDILGDLLPKKTPVYLVKCKDHIQILAANEAFLFFQHYDGPWYPTLRLLHQYPDLLPKLQVDRGAIRFVLSGANIMCPGLTSPGAKMEDCPVDCPVAIMAEGKEHAVAIGLTKMSTKDIAEINKGIGVDSITYLNDGLWRSNVSNLNLR